MQKPLITLAKDRDFAAGLTLQTGPHNKFAKFNRTKLMDQRVGGTRMAQKPESYQYSQQMGLETADQPT